MDNLFSGLVYPNVPGHKTGGTSRQAAAATKNRAPLLRDRVLNALAVSGPMTADECADRIGQHLLSVRPRFTELAKMGLIEETGERRTNASGMKANVYRITNQGEQQ